MRQVNSATCWAGVLPATGHPSKNWDYLVEGEILFWLKPWLHCYILHLKIRLCSVWLGLSSSLSAAFHPISRWSVSSVWPYQMLDMSMSWSPSLTVPLGRYQSENTQVYSNLKKAKIRLRPGRLISFVCLNFTFSFSYLVNCLTIYPVTL